MKFKRLAPAFLLCAALLFSGCSLKQSGSSAPLGGSVSGAVSSASVPPADSGKQVSEDLESPVPDSASGGAAGRGSADSASSRVCTEQNGPLKTIRTDNQKFNEKFQSNPIDRAYLPEINAAGTTLQMGNISGKYAALWEKEIGHAYDALKSALKTDPAKLKTVTDEQTKWEDGKAAALTKINSDAQTQGGSMARVQAASDTMDFYRDRASALYRQLYDYDKDFTYAYQ